jgi:hypothetical protein
VRDAKWTRALKTDAMLAMTLTLSLSADRTTSADFGADVSQNPIMLSGPVVTGWNATGRDAAYLFAGLVDRTTAGGAPDWTVLTVGAQFNAVNRSGVNQVVFGIATEAWAEQGSFLMLTGLEATTTNREPDNPRRKISLWSTFKNRPDNEYASYDPVARSLVWIDSAAKRADR